MHIIIIKIQCLEKLDKLQKLYNLKACRSNIVVSDNTLRYSTHEFYPRLKNLTKTNFDEKKTILIKGLKFCNNVTHGRGLNLLLLTLN